MNETWHEAVEAWCRARDARSAARTPAEHAAADDLLSVALALFQRWMDEQDGRASFEA